MMQRFWKKSQFSLTYLLYVLVILISISLIVSFDLNMRAQFAWAQNFAINHIHYAPASNWQYHANYYFQNAGVFLLDQESLNRATFSSDEQKVQFLIRFINLFGGQPLKALGSTNGLDLSDLAQFYDHFLIMNYWVQLFTFFTALLIICFILFSALYFWKTYLAIQNQNNHEFIKWQLVYWLFLVGIVIYWTYLKLAAQKQQQWMFSKLDQYPPFLWIKRIKLAKVAFNHQNENEPLIQVNQLSFTYQHKHNWFTHLKDLINLAIKNIKYKEQRHIEWKTQWKNKKNNHPLILKNLNFTIKKHGFTTILGPNGCGKSTLIKCLLNLEPHYFGMIKWNGIDIHDINKKSFAKNVSYFPQMLDLPAKINVYDFISFGRLAYMGANGQLSTSDREIIYDVLVKTNTLSFINKNLDELSGGQRQKVIIATILAQQTDTIILDEPSTFLDLKNQHELLQLLQQLHANQKTIITILHDINQAAAFSTDLIVLKAGEIYQMGPPAKVITPKLLKDVFNVNAEITRVDNTPFITNIEIN